MHHLSLAALAARGGSRLHAAPSLDSRGLSTGCYQPVAKVVTAFDRVCIPADCVAPRSHIPDMLPQSALSGGRSPGLDARGTFATDCYTSTATADLDRMNQVEEPT